MNEISIDSMRFPRLTAFLQRHPELNFDDACIFIENEFKKFEAEKKS